MAAPGGVAPDLVVATTVTATEPAASPTSKELESRASEYIAQERFNRRFTLPATDAHGELTITYGIGGLDSDAAPTVLFIGGMFGGRYLAGIADHVGRNLGIRIVVTDRPGMGGSTSVEPSLRLSVWLETVPALMRVLNATHLSLAAHSCGVIYALNTVYDMPWILPPSNRKLYLFSPWVAPEHSHATLMTISSYLPSPLINSFDSVVRFLNNNVKPTVHFSGAVSGVVSAPFIAAHGKEPEGRGKSVQRHERDDVCREYCGISAAEYAAREKMLLRMVFSESTSGANHEALLCLRKRAAGPWGACESYEDYPDALEAKLRASSPEGAAGEGDQGRLALRTFWAETDVMIGKGGEAYFDKCFQRFAADQQAPGDAQQSRRLTYESEVVPETNHETLCLPQYGALSRVLEDILGR